MTRRTPTRDVIVCCKPWNDEPPSRRDTWSWQVVHTWAHSRVPFSAERFADTTGVDIDHAADILAGATNRDWIAPVDAAGLYVGRLKARR